MNDWEASIPPDVVTGADKGVEINTDVTGIITPIVKF